MPGIGELIEGAVQQAPQPGRQETGSCGELMETGNATVGWRSNGWAFAGRRSSASILPAVLDCPNMQVYIR
jgi:hypothetical protein